MGKLKYTGKTQLKFDYQEREKILLPGQVYELENNSYIDGLIAQGILVAQAEPQNSKK